MDPLATGDATSSLCGDDEADGAVCRCAPRARAMRGVLERAAILDNLAPDVAITRSGDGVGDGAKVADKWLIEEKKKRKGWAVRLFKRDKLT